MLDSVVVVSSREQKACLAYINKKIGKRIILGIKRFKMKLIFGFKIFLIAAVSAIDECKADCYVQSEVCHLICIDNSVDQNTDARCHQACDRDLVNCLQGC